MSKQSLLLVDGDTRSLRVLEVSLRKAGFMVTAALSVQDALDKLELHAPDLIISETTFPDGDGFELRRRVRSSTEWSEIPFIFLTAVAAIENKIRGLELGVDDYLTKPIYIKEIVTRINILLQKRQRVRFEERRDGKTRFAGRVQDMPVVDVIQTIEISRKSGVIQFVGERGRQAAIYFRDGRVIDAEAGALQGEDAVYRLLTWSEGEFEVEFRTVRRREVITVSSQGLLMEGMRRLDEWSRLFEQLPPLAHRFEVDTIELAARLGDVPDDNNRILRLFDGKRTLLEVIDASDVGDLECLQAISRLYFEELLLDLDHGSAPRRDTGKPMPLADVEVPSPIKDVGSGPTEFDDPGLPPGKPAADGAAFGREDAAFAEDGAAFDEDPDAFEDAPAAGGTPVAAAQAADDEDAPGAADEGAPAEPDGAAIGPLMGGYRPSSLRLIDEAVAAAQAIEPSLFEEAVVAAAANQATGSHVSNGVSPRVSEASPQDAAPAAGADPGAGSAAGSAPAASPGTPPRSPESSVRLTAAEREESGLRMIGSLGRDRAEASGELAPPGQTRPLRSETARELVTILPRRITREIPVMTRELAESLPTPTPTSPVLVAKPAVAPAVESPVTPVPAPRVLPGSGVRRSRRLFGMSRDGRGPGLGALMLLILAALFAGAAVFLRLRRHAAPSSSEVAPAPPPASQSGASGPSGPEGMGMAGSGSGPAAGIGHPEDGRAGGRAETAGTVPREPGGRAGSGASGTGTPGTRAGSGAGSAAGTRAGKPGEPGAATPDKLAEAKALYDKAHDAMEESNFAQALALTEASLKLRKTARTYLLRAQAEQRLDRVDAALASVDAAAALAPDFAMVWETRGRILWAARRRDDARAAFEKFLALEPNSPKAAAVRRLMNEPR